MAACRHNDFCEADKVPPFSRVYDGLIHTLAITVREIAEDMNMPFVTFQILPYWVGTESDRNAVQNALRDVGTRIPYAASIDATNLPGSSLDAVHYSAAQQAKLSNRFFGAWNTAKASALAYPPPITDLILIIRQELSLFTNR